MLIWNRCRSPTKIWFMWWLQLRRQWRQWLQRRCTFSVQLEKRSAASLETLHLCCFKCKLCPVVDYQTRARFNHCLGISFRFSTKSFAQHNYFSNWARKTYLNRHSVEMSHLQNYANIFKETMRRIHCLSTQTKLKLLIIPLFGFSTQNIYMARLFTLGIWRIIFML